MKSSTLEDNLRTEMEKLGAREFETVALSGDPARGLAALAYAYAKAATNPIPYAIKMYESDWQPSGESRRVATNLSVDRRCSACGGDRFVPVTDDWRVLYGETYAPCAVCNASANTEFWTARGERFVSPAR